MFDFLKIETVSRWAKQSDYIIGFGSLVIACVLSLSYFLAWSGPIRSSAGILDYLIMAYPAICLGRLAWYRQKSRKRAVLKAEASEKEAPYAETFGWLCAFSDVIFLTIITYSLSASFSAPSVALQSPYYVGYFVYMALHALRLNPVQVWGVGGIACLSWVSLVAILILNGAGTTSLFNDYTNSGLISIKAEAAKVGCLWLASAFLWFATKRAKSLLDAVIETRMLDRKLRAANVAVAAKSEVLDNMNQDIKGPISGVMGMSEALRGTDLTKEQTRYVDAIEKSSQTLLTVVQNVLDITQADEASVKSKFSEFNMQVTVEKLGLRYGSLARKKKIDFLIDINPKSQTYIIGSEKRFIQTLSNILDNAVKFSHTGCIKLKVSCEAIDAENAKLEVAISDTGVGMNAEKLERLKDRLSGKIQASGDAGLGLMIAQMFVQVRGGGLNIESKPAEGTTVSFGFSVPYAKKAVPPHPISNELRKIRGQRILIVDDQPISGDVLQAQLVSMGVIPQMVVDVENACAAINAAHNAGKTYDIVMIDYDMPDTDGLHLAKLIRSREELNNTQLIIFSSVDDQTVEQNFRDVGITAYLKKPYRVSDIQDSLLKVIEMPKSSEGVAKVA